MSFFIHSDTCIKGHRSSACKHTDRPLYEIKKKGRPVTQCEHCRELRKTKQVHVKCICHKEETVAGGDQASGCSNQGSAAFPNGLPKALEASVAVQLLSQGATSDSDLGRFFPFSSSHGCSCLSGDECHCWTPRKAAPRVRKKGKTVSELPASTPSPSESQTAPKAQNSSNVSNRLADFRALLPKPAHDPSSSTALTVGRYHPHELYSPYGRVHGQLHPNQSTPAPLPDAFDHVDPPAYPPRTLLPTHDARLIQAVHPEFDAADIEAWNSFQMTGAANIAGSLCGCGDECACPNCIVHKLNDNRPRLNASKCGQPDACRNCIDCAASFSYQSTRDMPPNTALSIYDNTYALPERGSIDDWIRQMQNSISPSQP
ncbi:hypothetical protein GG344DRAFT_50218, partial [Lentinula edodes]